MILYKWILSPDQPLNKNTLLELQTRLLVLGVFLDLSWENDRLNMTIAVPEEAAERAAALKSFDNISAALIPGDDRPKRRGRPCVRPENDITLARVRHMQFMGISAGEIAAKIGVSRRTFYRKLEQTRGKNPDPETPFSQW